MRTIIINTSNDVANTGNQYIYNFSSTVKFNDGDAIGVSLIALYNSTFNITSSRGNNTFTILWNAVSLPWGKLYNKINKNTSLT